MYISPTLLLALFAALDVTQAQNTNIATQCRLVPSAGLCTTTRREFWSYSAKTGGCVRLFGCYSLQDRNVFLTKDGCENGCLRGDSNTGLPVVIPGSPGVTIALECRMNPSAGQCRPSEVRRFWTYSSKIGSCTQVTGCYSINDRNVWLTKEGCDRGCFVRAGLTPAPPRPRPTMPDIIPKTTTPPRNEVSIGCRYTPSPGVCRPQDKKTFYSYSSKTNGCEQIFGCYTIRDRNVFLSREGCQRSCFNSGTNPGQDWTMPSQCYMNAQPGQCSRQKRFYTYSSKLSGCTDILGCYSIRDRNVFLTLEGCQKTCAGSTRPVLPDVQPNTKIALECRITPTGGSCPASDKKTFWSYSGKTGDCEEIYGCFGVRDRNVFLGKPGCRRACFINGGEQVAGMAESQCYIIPSPGRCAQNQRRSYFSYSPKVNRCVQLRGCYSVRDRNVFLTNDGCSQTCSGNSTTLVLDPEYAGMDIAAECMLNPSPGRCQSNQKRDYYSYSWKAGGCIKLTGCFSVRDRNVFLSRDGCRNNCYVDKTQTGPSQQRASECYVTPSPGRCARNQERKYWTFSTKTNGCMEILGCYNIRDRNVFLMQQGCDRRCAVDSSVTPSPLPDTGLTLALECRVNPSSGVCRENEKRSFYSYSSKTGVCEQIYGCYSVRDRNVFLSREGCRKNCFVNSTNQPSGNLQTQCYMSPSPGRCMESQKKSYWTYSTKTSGCGQIYGCYGVRDRNVFVTKETCRRACNSGLNSTELIPDLTGLDLHISCRFNPAPGQCRESQKKTFYTYSGKTGSCVEIRGCYTLADRNVYLTREGCYNGCFFNRTNPPTGNTNIECYITPVAGRCPDVERQRYYTFSEKTNDCVSIYGCYNLRDRNVFLSRDGCRYNCAQDFPVDSVARLNVEDNFVTLPVSSGVSAECRSMPSPGQCPANQKKTYYVFSSKTGTCVSITGCYTIRDRNVFLNKESCDNRCFQNETAPSAGIDGQCFMNPSPGRCAASQRRRYYSYSSKTRRCEEIMGCYSVRDRNVFLSRVGCNGVCAVDPNVTIIPLPDGPGISVSFECLVNPSVGQCRETQKRSYYSYSGKVGGCLPIYGCYSVQDRNVFLSSEGCTRKCFVNTTETPSGTKDLQCYSNPSSGRCRESEKRRYWTYSLKTQTCTTIFGCYSIRDRNVFLGREGCERACAVDSSMTVVLPAGLSVAVECRMNPSQGVCPSNQKKSYHSYSSKTGVCEEIYGCYSIRDRNVFLTREGCRRNCFVNTSSPTPSGQRDMQCYLNPSQGSCSQNQVRSLWTYSSKLGRCTTIRGCYSVRDRNVFLGREGCERACAVDTSNPLPDIPDGQLATECYVSPMPGRCAANQRRNFYSFSDKTRSCVQINGCYSVRDRNVFLTREGCDRNCFLNDGGSQGRNIQCYVTPSPGRCAASDRRRYFTFTSKTGNCQPLFGCYSVGDRNVFLSQEGCSRACGYDSALNAGNTVSTGTVNSGVNGGRSGFNGVGSGGSGFNGRTGGNGGSGFNDGTGGGGGSGFNGGNGGSGGSGFNDGTGGGGGSGFNGGTGGNGGSGFNDGTGGGGGSGFNGGTGGNGGSGFNDGTGGGGGSGFNGGSGGSGFNGGSGGSGFNGGSGGSGFNGGSGGSGFNGGSGGSGFNGGSGGSGFNGGNGGSGFNGGSGGSGFNGGSGGSGFNGGNGGSGFNGGSSVNGGRSSRINNGGNTVMDTGMTTVTNVVDVSTSRRGGTWNADMTTVTTVIDNNQGAGSFGVNTLTDIPSVNVEPGVRITRECQLTPTPGICPSNRMRTFWTFSSKTNSCTMITGCYDIHDRNTWLTQEGCIRGCFRREGETLQPGFIPLECQLNPTPGRCHIEEENTFWMYNTKLGVCVRITGCYDFHDRNVWSSEDRCRSKCNAGDYGTILPEIQPGLKIDAECKINPPPGRCLDSERKTFWSFSSKTLACTRIRGCITLRDRNTWMTREGCQRNCLVNETDISGPQTDVPFDCQLVPSPGLCLESQQVSVWTYSNKLGGCVQIQGCYNFHDRNVWMSSESCQKNCHASGFGITLPELSGYRISLECRLNPSPGQCPDNMKRSFFSFSSKIGDCVPIYGCYTIKDRNVHFTREGCRRNCLIPTRDSVYPACMTKPAPVPCNGNSNGQTNWWSYDTTAGTCAATDGCYKRGDRNVFVSKQKCEENCYRTSPEPGQNGNSFECKINPSPGGCQQNAARSFWSYSSKSSSCTSITGCYSIRDRNVFLTKEKCEQVCQGQIVPNFMAALSNEQNNVASDRGRRGRQFRTRNRQPQTSRINGEIPGVLMMGSSQRNGNSRATMSVPPRREFQASSQFVTSRVLTNLF